MQAPATQPSAYRRILVPVDNSKHSDGALRLAVRLARQLGSTIVGFHAYAALLHERRFMQMVPGLPDRYSDTELQRQRSVHESLISKGMRLISESYLDQAREQCEAAGVPFEGRLAEGTNYQEIVREARSGQYDLVALGALGLGARRRSLIGSVCERVLRAVPGDVLVARDGQPEAKGVMAAIDGSPNSYQALDTGLSLATAMEEPVEVVSVYDPQFHIVAFERLAKVLSAEAASLFRFNEQEQLHSEIIDKGLERLYRGYLRKAEDLASGRGLEAQATILAGKPFQKLADHVEERRPRLLVVGRFGQHATELSAIGSTAENLVRSAACSVLVVNGSLDAPGTGEPATDEAPGVPWSPEARARLQSVSAFAQPIVRTAVESYARRHGCPEVTPEIMTRAREALGW